MPTTPTIDAALVLFTLPPRAECARKGLHAGVVESLLEALHSVATSLSGVDLLVASPETPRHRSLGVHDLRQRGQGFGESLRLAVEDAFALGYHRVVVIGNDAPEISKTYLEEAFASLDSSEPAAVLGPAADGGYNLLGLNAPCRAAFEDIAWGTNRVAAATESRLRDSGFSVRRLATLADIDDAAGLFQFVLRLRRCGARAPGRLRRLARRLESLARTSPWRPEVSASTPRAAFGESVQLRAPPF